MVFFVGFCAFLAVVFLAVVFLAGFFGFKVTGERVRLESLGLAAFVFVFFWNAWAQT